VTVDCAYYHVDVGQKYAWSEGAPGITDFAATDRRAGLLKVYVRNDGAAPVAVQAQALNGQPLQALRDVGAALVAGNRHDLAAPARTETAARHIMGRYQAYVHEVSTPLNAYGTEAGGFFNPDNIKYPGLEWWTEQTPRGGEWRVAIPPEQAGQKHRIYFQTQSWWNGEHLRIEVVGPDGKEVFAQDRQDPPQFNERAVVTLPQAGEYAIRLLEAGEGKPGGRMSRFIYVVPEVAGPLPEPAW
jgi:hypothetical protein